MLRSLILLCLFLLCSMLEAQLPESFYHQGPARVKKLLPGDSIRVCLDTLYLMNRFTFHIFSDGMKNSLEVKAFVKESMHLYEQELLKRDAAYEQLKTLAVQQQQLAVEHRNKMETDIKSLSGKLITAEAQLAKAQKASLDLEQELKKQRWRNMRGKAGWGLGGLCAGMLMMLVFN